jgi:hypothetical protein
MVPWTATIDQAGVCVSVMFARIMTFSGNVCQAGPWGEESVAPISNDPLASCPPACPRPTHRHPAPSHKLLLPPQLTFMLDAGHSFYTSAFGKVIVWKTLVPHVAIAPCPSALE